MPFAGPERITDETGAVIWNASVEVSDASTGMKRTIITDRDGMYRFSFLAPAKYTLAVKHPGFRPEIRLANVSPSTVNIVLHVANTSTEITVPAEAPPIQADNGDVSDTKTEKQISEVPRQ